MGFGGPVPRELLPDDPHSVHLVDLVPGGVEVHHDQVPCLGCVSMHGQEVQNCACSRIW